MTEQSAGTEMIGRTQNDGECSGANETSEHGQSNDTDERYAVGFREQLQLRQLMVTMSERTRKQRLAKKV